MSAGHTPGPWYWLPPTPGGYRIVCGYGFRRQSIARVHRHLDIEPVEANARLIAAAPDLFDSLTEYQIPLSGSRERDEAEFGALEVERELRRRAAISKATGSAA